jgi:hypothetical protein
MRFAITAPAWARVVCLCAGIGLTLATTPAIAAEPGDQWEITVKIDMPGMPVSMPPQTTRVCLAKQARDADYVPKSQGECQVQDTHRSGKTLRYRMECRGKETVTLDGEITMGADSYHGRMQMHSKSAGDDFAMSQTFSGRKVGECANPMREG